MKYMPLDLSVMQPEPFPHPVMMRSDLYPRRQPSREEKWGICPGSVCGALRALVRRCREEAKRRKLAMNILSVAGACVFGLMAVGVFWLAVCFFRLKRLRTHERFRQEWAPDFQRGFFYPQSNLNGRDGEGLEFG